MIRKSTAILVLIIVVLLLAILAVRLRADTLCGPLSLQHVAVLRGVEAPEMSLDDLVRVGGGTAVRCPLSDLTYPSICHTWGGHYVVAESAGVFWDEGKIIHEIADYSGFAIVYGPVPAGRPGDVALILSQYVWDLGEVWEGTVVTLPLGTSGTPVLGAEGSCDCLTWLDGTVLFNSAGQRGVQHKRLVFKSADLVGDVVLRVEGVVLPVALQHFPETLDFSKVQSRRLIVDPAYKILSVEGEGVTCIITNSREPGIVVTWTGRGNGLLEVRTTHPKDPVHTISMTKE